MCVSSACYKQIIEAANRDDIAVLTEGKLMGGDTEKREMEMREIQPWDKRGRRERHG